MHGLVNQSLQCFLQDAYGTACWDEIRRGAGVDALGFEAMLIYDDAITEALIAAATARLGRPRDALLEDLGHYLVTWPGRDTLRRLLRFGGESFADFLHSLGRLRDRGRLVLPELDLPEITVREASGGRFRLLLRWPGPCYGPAMVGLLRAMADDYGALALCERQPMPRARGAELVHVHLLAATHSEGRAFDLGRVARP